MRIGWVWACSYLYPLSFILSVLVWNKIYYHSSQNKKEKHMGYDPTTRQLGMMSAREVGPPREGRSEVTDCYIQELLLVFQRYIEF